MVISVQTSSAKSNRPLALLDVTKYFNVRFLFFDFAYLDVLDVCLFERLRVAVAIAEAQERNLSAY